MTSSFSRFGRWSLLPAIAVGASLSSLVAQSPDPLPATAPLKTEAELGAPAPVDAKGGRRAPRGTFYMLTYVAAQTDKGVEGFTPGQEVHFVEVHRDKRTLVVSNGRAQVEVPPSKLTNDTSIAAMVRQNDQASQAQIAAYLQKEEEAYEKEQRKAAESTAKNIEQHQEREAAAARQADQAQAARDSAQPTDTTVAASGYYGSNGAGYGSPYSYFSGPIEVSAPLSAPAPAQAPAASVPNKVAVPPSSGAGKPR